mgnify:FL=1
MTEFDIKLGVSARHMHLKQEDLEVLFGKGHELTYMRPITQPGQFASEEFVTMVTEKGQIKLRVLGPVRPYTQIELSLTDCRVGGLKPPFRKSGGLEGTPGCKLVGPKGEVPLDKGVIVAARHVHLYPETAEKYGLKENDIVEIVTKGERALVLQNVLVRSSVKDADEIHLDTDEANAGGLKEGDMLTIRKMD